MCTPTQGVWQPAGCVSCEPVCVCVSLVRVVIICPASTHTALVSSPSLAVLHLTTYLPDYCGEATTHSSHRHKKMCGECAGCLWARERYAMSALRCFITSKAKLKKWEILSRGSRGGYPLAALGSEDWCDAIHAGVFSGGRPSVHGVAPSPTAPASSRGRAGLTPASPET